MLAVTRRALAWPICTLGAGLSRRASGHVSLQQLVRTTWAWNIGFLVLTKKHFTSRTTSGRPFLCQTLGTSCGGRGSARLGGLSHIESQVVDVYNGLVGVCHRLISRTFVDMPRLTAFFSQRPFLLSVQVSLLSFFLFLQLFNLRASPACLSLHQFVFL